MRKLRLGGQSVGSSHSLHGRQPKRYDPDTRRYYKWDSLPISLQGLAEYIVSTVLECCSVGGHPIQHAGYVLCEEDDLRGVYSSAFCTRGEREVPVSTLLYTQQGIENLEQFDVPGRLERVVKVCATLTGLQGVTTFIGVQLLIDYLLLNEDRHWSNISFIRDVNGVYRFAPYFDFGEALRMFDPSRVEDSWCHYEPQPYLQEQLECLDTLLQGQPLTLDLTAWGRQKEAIRAKAGEVYLDTEVNSVLQKFLVALLSFPQKDLLRVI